jgi:Macrocin-O-methyltransferase (TylF)
MRRLKSLARRIGRGLGRQASGEAFYSANPQVLVALVRAFRQQRSDLLTGAGYYEFGLYRGMSLWFAEQISRGATDASFRFFGFDSFAGLPAPRLEREAAVYARGDYACSLSVVRQNLKKYGADLERIGLYKGFFEPAHFARLARGETFSPVSIALIDVDLYESSGPVLDFIAPYLVGGSILIFDDYNQFGVDDQSGERRALLEFGVRYPEIGLEHLWDYGREGSAFRVLSVGATNASVPERTSGG